MLVTQNFFLVRTPSFSNDRLLELNRSIQNKNITLVKNIFKDKFFLDAIYFSSRYFYKVALDWIKDTTVNFSVDDNILISLYKYYVRICTRSTPYGLFAGFSTGNINNEKSKITFNSNLHEPILRVDMLFLKKTINNIIKDNLDKNVLLYPNNTIYKIDNELRFIEWNKEFNYEISKIETSFLINLILEKSEKGITYSDIVLIIKKELPEANMNQIKGFVNQLIANKLLVNQVPPYVTSNQDPLLDVQKYLKELNIDANPIQKIKNCSLSNKLKINVQDIEKLAIENSSLVDDKTQIFQVDTKLNLEHKNINEKITKTLTKNAIDLLGISKPNISARITEFCNKFYEKFEDKEIPLVRALDPELGVGYDFYTSGNVEETPLLSNVSLSFSEDEEKTSIPPIIKIIIKKYINTFSNQNTIILSEEDIKSISRPVDYNLLCEDYCLFGSLISKSENLDTGNFKFHSQSSIPSPYSKNLLSRFAYHDNNLKDCIKRTIPKSSDYVYAEIVHYPSDRIGNILLRPNFFEHEIPYTSPSNGEKNKIGITDIMISVRGGSVILRSKSKNKIIKPRFSTAFNYELSQLSMIKFFCDLQYHNKYVGFKWDWSILNQSKYLPRVEYKNLILAEERWKLEKDKNITKKVLKNHLKESNIPRYCKIKEGDNILELDIECDISINIIVKFLKKNDLLIYESIKGEQLVKSSLGVHSAEFIFPLLKQHTNNTKSVIKTITTNDRLEVNQKYFPSDEWTYFKIYCSHGVADQIISEVLKPIVNNEKSISFFIRYADPENHIRFRVKSNNVEKLLTTLKEKLKYFTTSGFVSKIQIDTYNREINRYGANNIDLSEEFFHYDSLAIIEFIELLLKNNDENLRWKTAVASIDIMLDDFNINYQERVVLFSQLYESFFPEFVNIKDKVAVKDFKRSIDKKMRDNKNDLDAILRLKEYHQIASLIHPFKERTKKNKIISELINNNFEDKSAFLGLLKSYIHMSLNRIFPTKARVHELIIYFFMYKQYNSILRRNG